MRYHRGDVKVLFIGGTGVISSACARAAIAAGMDLSLVCRGTSARPVPPEARVIAGDIRDAAWAHRTLGHERFDVVVDWVGFVPRNVELDVELFRGRVRQYVFISSASVYEPSALRLPIVESSTRGNLHWAYARDKVACEELLFEAFRRDGFPATIVRPSHTYDLGLLPVRGGWATVDRMRRGLPVVIAGDGASLWTLTHHEDFARGLVGLLGLDAALGEAFHITSEEALSWNAIYELVAEAAGARLRAVHVPVDVIAACDPPWGASLLGDKAVSKVFDNSKIRSLVPGYRAEIGYAQGAGMQVGWYDGDPLRRRVDPAVGETTDRILRHVTSRM
jgi:nucleoside-diphosphate-sugar epimerase